MTHGIAASRPRAPLVILLAVGLLAVVLLGGSQALASASPSVETDRHHYHGGDTVVITGSGFAPGAHLAVTVTDPEGDVAFSADVVTDGLGNFEVGYVFEVGSPHGTYLVEVLDAAGNDLASTSFEGGTHFRYAHISWAPGPGTNEVVFTFQGAFRRSAYGAPLVGDTITEFTGNTNLSFGDGSSTGTLSFVVTSIDPVNDWLLGVALDPTTGTPGVRHTYAAPGSYTAFSESCCRISSAATPNDHINNPDGPYRAETLVSVGTGDRSATSVVPPIVLCPIDAVCSFNVPASDPDGDALHWRLSSDVEASGFAGGFTQPGPPDATNAASIGAATGVYSWDTTGATLGGAGLNTLYSTQVTVESRDGTGAVKSKVAVDFLIQLVEVVGAAPVFDTPPTPACGSTVAASVGASVSFTVQASDPDAGDTVTLNVVGLPIGATMTPGLPVSGNPVSSVFSWTPGATQVGPQLVTFTATDQTGQSAVCTLTVDVDDAPPPPEPQECTLIAGRHIEAGTVSMIDDGTNLTVTYTTTGGWMLTRTHLAVGDDVSDIPQNMAGSPTPGLFAYKTVHDPAVTTHTYVVPLPGNDGTVVVAAHANVMRVDGATVQTETAWGEGPRFRERGDWSMYCVYETD